MPITRFLLTISSLLICAPALLHAEDAALPPPTVQESGKAVAVSAADVTESAPNLHETLSPEKDDTAVDVRSYQREDGATITEYGVGGRVYKIKVQPAGGLPAYYLHRNKAGTFERRLPGGLKPLAAPSWILKEF